MSQLKDLRLLDGIVDGKLPKMIEFRQDRVGDFFVVFRIVRVARDEKAALGGFRARMAEFASSKASRASWVCDTQ